MDYTNMNAEFRSDYYIASPTANDSGTYTCTVTNPIGTANATITVQVIGEFII